MGYDLIAFSGGKAIRGPQCAGLLIGKKDLIAYALLNNSLHEDTIGRSQKVGKEEIVGMVKAVELYLQEDQEALNKEWQRWLEHISAQVTKVPSVTTSHRASHGRARRGSFDELLHAAAGRGKIIGSELVKLLKAHLA